MTEVTVTLSVLSAMNVISLIDRRLEEIEELAVKHPDLPMRDPQMIADYESAKQTLKAAVAERLNRSRY